MASEILKSIHNLSKSKLNIEVFLLGDISPKAKGKFSQYVKKIDWIITDLKTDPAVSKDLRDAIEQEYLSDTYTVDAITEKALLLSPSERDVLENIIDAIIKGEPIEIIYTDKKQDNEKDNDTKAA
jgi:hypothetical protein